MGESAECGQLFIDNGQKNPRSEERGPMFSYRRGMERMPRR